MNRLHGRVVLVRCWSRFDMGDDVRGFCVTRFGQMDLLSSPVMAPFFAVSDFQIVGRGDQPRRGWKVPHSIGFSGRQRSLFCPGQLDPWFSVHTLSTTTSFAVK